MKVWLITAGCLYEFVFFVEVYTTKGKAEKKREEIESLYDWVEVEEIEVK